MQLHSISVSHYLMLRHILRHDGPSYRAVACFADVATKLTKLLVHQLTMSLLSHSIRRLVLPYYPLVADSHNDFPERAKRSSRRVKWRTSITGQGLLGIGVAFTALGLDMLNLGLDEYAISFSCCRAALRVPSLTCIPHGAWCHQVFPAMVCC